ncbi:hypothetical protein I4U23_004259 [Adineta vaga]|nr:hypothetical protein I4U23_004259 [Adineta vaga]
MACGSTSSMTCFEDLSNELIYEIFDHLDFYHINESFSNLNSRFNNLINSPICPIKVNLSSISKSTFEHYYTHIIIPYPNRITLLRLSNCFIADIHPIPYNHMFRLQTLILQEIESKQLGDILTDLSDLPLLSSLILKPIDTVDDVNSLYRLIFRLPFLKYCAVTTNGHISSEPLPFATCVDFSPIETFLINSSCYIDELNALLSYVPHIRYLSCDIKFNEPILIRPLELNNLTRLRLKMKHLPFDQIVLLLKNLFNHLQIFYIITDYSSSYIDPNQWEQIRLSFLSNLLFFSS